MRKKITVEGSVLPVDRTFFFREKGKRYPSGLPEPLDGLLMNRLGLRTTNVHGAIHGLRGSRVKITIELK